MTAHLRTDYIRVQDKTSGIHFTMAASAHDPAEADLIKDAAAVDVNGVPLPPEYPEAPESLSSQPAGQKATKKEGA